jgi:two-component system, cell cycle sensor histidine kinase and response regulator CckA
MDGVGEEGRDAAAPGSPASTEDRSSPLAEQILESITDGIVFVDSQGKCFYANQRAGALLGREPGELLGEALWAQLPEDAAATLRGACERAGREQIVLEITTQLQGRAPEAARWIEHRIFPSKGGVTICSRDVTERRAEAEERARARAAQQAAATGAQARLEMTEVLEAAEALRRSEEWLAIALDGARMGLWDWQISTNAVHWSDGVERLFGVTSGTFEGTYDAYLACIHPADRSRVTTTIRRSLEAGEEYAVEHRVIWPDGSTHALSATGKVYRDERGRAVRMAGCVLDVTEARRAAEDRRTFALLVENATDFIGLAGLDGRVLFINEAGLRLVGLDGLDEAVSRTVGDFLTPEGQRQSLEVELPSVLATGRWEGDCQLVNFKTGQLIDVMSASFVIPDPATGAPLCLATVRHDVTARRALEAQLRQAQKMEAIGRLAAGVAHDFNNLLTVIAGMTSLIARDPSLSQQAQAHLGEIEFTVQRATALTRGLLSYSRQRQLRPLVLDLNEVVTQVSKLLSRLLPAEIELRVALAPGLLPVLADRDQVEQALLNLAVNARDAMPEGGVLTVATATEGDRVSLSVADTGIGMSPELRARIAEPFFTTKEEGRGTGLGLSTVQALVAQSGGELDLATEPGAGSVFTIRLSRSHELPAPRALLARGPRRHPSAGTVLLIEDDGAVRATLKQSLEAEGFLVLDTGAPEVALRIARSHGSSISLLLTDMQLPSMGGRELARRISEAWPALKVLFVTGLEQPPTLPVGPEPILHKPFTAEELVRKVRELLER